MKRSIPRIFFWCILTALMTLNGDVSAQEGRVLSISGKTIVAGFENVTASVGDEVEILHVQSIVDPVTQKVRGERTIPIAKGVIIDIGLGKVNVRVEATEGRQIEVDDIVRLTGRGKKIIRPEGPRFGEIQEITDETIVTNLGSADEISPGDIFLIQRNEPVFDPDTKELVGTNSVNVGRYSVNTVGDGTSVAKVIEQNLIPQKTDIVYKESEYLEYIAMMQSDSARIARIEEEVADLKRQLRDARSKLDNLEASHTAHLNDYETLKRDIETVVTRLMSGDIKDVRLRIKNDEPAAAVQSKDLLASYERALKDCLDHKLETAIRQFNDIISRYPESKLTENCRYWIAQSYFSLKAYPQAAEGFQAVINDTRFTHKDDDASIMLGITYLRMNRPDDARAQFEEFIKLYPASEYRSKVNYWLGMLET